MTEALSSHGVTPRYVYEQTSAAIEGSNHDYRAVLALALEFSEPRPGRLQGVPILVKDNIDTADLPTTAGSSLFAGLFAPRNARVVDEILNAGATIVGKTNLSEWANFRGANSVSGWSALGGLTVNPFDSRRSAGGSSSGSAVAVALGYVPCAIGTETDGSIICPASLNGVVGFKPTPRWISTEGVVPVSYSQDSVGFFTRTFGDLSVILEGLYGHAIRPVNQLRLALPVESYDVLAWHARKLFREVTDYLEATDLQVVAVESPYFRSLSPNVEQEFDLLVAEFASGIETYLSGRAVPGLESLADLVVANQQAAPIELSLFGQEIFEAALNPISPARLRALRRSLKSKARQAVVERLAFAEADALLVPAMNPAWLIDTVNGDPDVPSGYGVAAVGALPSICLPMGLVDDLPCGLCLIGRPGGDLGLLRAASLVAQRLAVSLVPPDAPGPFRPGGWTLGSDPHSTVVE